MSAIIRRPPKLLSIVGFDRSGTTLLGLLLGQAKGFCAIGECYRIWKCFAENWLCGCGEPLRRCEFWSQVVQRTVGTMTVSDAERLETLRLSIYHRRGVMLKTALGITSREHLQAGRELSLITAGLYATIGDLSSCGVIVDSTFPHYAASCAGVDGAYVVHIVRDPRGVAYSFGKLKSLISVDGLMTRQAAGKTAANWVVNALMTTWFGSRMPGRYLTVRYEDLTENPAGELRRVIEFIGEPASDLSFIQGARAFLAPQHIVAGNPAKFHNGAISISADREWETRMAGRDRAIVSLLTSPLLIRYGYPIRPYRYES